MHIATLHSKPSSTGAASYLQTSAVDSDALEPLEYIKSNLRIVIDPACVKHIKDSLLSRIVAPEDGGIVFDDFNPITETTQCEDTDGLLAPEDNFNFYPTEDDVEAATIEFLGDGVALLAFEHEYLKGDQLKTIKIQNLAELNQHISQKIAVKNGSEEEFLQGLRFILMNERLEDDLLLSRLETGGLDINHSYNCNAVANKDRFLLTAIKKDVQRNGCMLHEIQDETLKLEAYVTLITYYEQNKPAAGAINILIWSLFQNYFMLETNQNCIYQGLLLLFSQQWRMENNQERTQILSLIHDIFSKITDDQKEAVIACIIHNTALDADMRAAVVQQNVSDTNISETLIQSLPEPDENKPSVRTKSARK